MKTPDKPLYIVPFTSDFGFKKAFADETDTSFARKAIEVLASLKKPLKELEYIRNETIGLNPSSRKGIIDVFCRDENNNVFISEMQREGYDNMIERLVFYILHVFFTMVKRGKKGFENIKPIHCICISSLKMLETEGYYQKITFKNQRNQTIFNKIRIYIVELSKFTKSIKDCKTDLDKLIYTMKNGHKIDLNDKSGIPPFWGEEWLNQVIEKLNEANLSPEEQFSLNIEWAQAMAEKERHERMEKKEAALTSKESALTSKESALTSKESALTSKENKLTSKETELGEKEIALKTSEAELERMKVEAEQKLKKIELIEAQAAQRKMTDTTITALNNGMTSKQISEILNFPLEFVEKVKSSLKSKN